MDLAPRVAAVPVGPACRDPAHLWREVEDGVSAAAAGGACLAVLPELALLPYVAGDDPVNWRHLAETATGPTASRMGALARRHRIDIVFGMALLDGPRLPLNAAMVAHSDGSLTRLATKIRLPPAASGDRFGEADHFRSGCADPRAIRIGPLRVSALVCYDRRFAESWDRAAAGADLVAVLVGGPAPQDPPGHFLAELAGHAERCRVHAVAACRYGTEHVLGVPVRHDGDSAIVGPDGRVLATTDSVRPHIVIAAVDSEVAGRSEPIPLLETA